MNFYIKTKFNKQYKTMNLHNTNSISNLNNGFIRHRSKIYTKNCIQGCVD